MKRVISLLLTILLLLWGCRPARQVARGYLRGDTTNDPRQLLRWTQIYGNLESCCDICEQAADVMETVMFKNA